MIPIKILMFIIQLNRKIEKEQRNKERIIEDQSKYEDELRGTNVQHANASKASRATYNDQEKEMKRLEQRESVLKVFA